MRTTTISSKGQVTLPAAVLREKHLDAGTILLVVPLDDGLVLLRRPDSLADSLAGSTPGAYGDADEYVDGERDTWS